jgi:hypothetical protein
MKLLPVIALIILSSCSTKRYLTESVNLKPQEDKYHVQAKLVKVRPTMRGYKHTFVTDKAKDTIYRYYQRPLQTDSCYMVWKTKLDK